MLMGLTQTPIKDEIELYLEFPSRLVPLLKNGDIDIALLPVVALAELSDYHIVSDYCISTEDEVASVAIFSQVPLEEIEAVILDYQSRTSVMLTKFLFKKYWKKEVRFVPALQEDYYDQISGNTAGLIIGDRALKYTGKSTFHYDLGSAWKAMTGLPFVFAVWVSVKEMRKEFLSRFSAANGLGVDNIDEVIDQINFPQYDLSLYFKKNISYPLTEIKRKSIQLFLDQVKDL